MDESPAYIGILLFLLFIYHYRKFFSIYYLRVNSRDRRANNRKYLWYIYWTLESRCVCCCFFVCKKKFRNDDRCSHGIASQILYLEWWNWYFTIKYYVFDLGSMKFERLQLYTYCANTTQLKYSFFKIALRFHSLRQRTKVENDGKGF